MKNSSKSRFCKKATKYGEITTLDLSFVNSKRQIYGRDFSKFCGFLKIYELYQPELPELESGETKKSVLEIWPNLWAGVMKVS